MTLEEKQALLQFVGQTYGQATKTDNFIVGGSNSIRPVGQDFKSHFEQILHAPVIDSNENQPAPVYEQQAHAQPAIAQVTHEQAIQELAQTTTVTPQIQHVTQAPVANTDLIQVLQDINLTLGRIANTLEKKKVTPNVTTKKTKAKVPD
jgi:hypothetical protein